MTLADWSATDDRFDSLVYVGKDVTIADVKRWVREMLAERYHLRGLLDEARPLAMYVWATRTGESSRNASHLVDLIDEALGE